MGGVALIFDFKGVISKYSGMRTYGFFPSSGDLQVGEKVGNSVFKEHCDGLGGGRVEGVHSSLLQAEVSVWHRIR
jgi:hypothetical protein